LQEASPKTQRLARTAVRLRMLHGKKECAEPLRAAQINFCWIGTVKTKARQRKNSAPDIAWLKRRRRRHDA
jgi:hypothetical protein